MTTTTTRHSYRTEFGVEMRRISWTQFWALRPDLRPVANDNNPHPAASAA